MKSRLLLSALAVAALFSTSAMAAKLAPGQWDIAGIQQICLVDDGTWYSTTFFGWTGYWQSIPSPTKVKTVVYGNYAVTKKGHTGNGNDSFVVRKGLKAGWTEWQNYSTAVGFMDKVQFTFVKTDCDPAANKHHANGANPMD